MQKPSPCQTFITRAKHSSPDKLLELNANDDCQICANSERRTQHIENKQLFLEKKKRIGKYGHIAPETWRQIFPCFTPC